MSIKFADLNLDKNILSAVRSEGYESPTPIQAQAIPFALEGRDIMASAQTGSGKTAAFLLPTLQRLTKRSEKPGKGPRALVLTPTRELAAQVEKNALAYAKNMRWFRTVSIVGGASFGYQTRALSKPVDLIVATPGRLMDLMQSGKVDFARLEVLILDEADRMLDMGFFDDIMQIYKQLPSSCQTVMFSATMPPKIRKLAASILRDPIEVEIAISRPPESIMQSAYICYEAQKLPILRKLFEQSAPKRTIIFASAKLKVRELTSTLRKMGFNVADMHSDLEQSQREQVMRDFKNGYVDVLVATDIVARGIDIDNIRVVINYDIPHDPEDYVHRIGRTARGTNGEGLAITFVSEEEQSDFHKIETFLGKSVYKLPVDPEFGEVPAYEPAKRRPRRSGRSGDGRSGRSEKDKRQGKTAPNGRKRGGTRQRR